MTKPLPVEIKEQRKLERFMNSKEKTKRTPEGRQREILRLMKKNSLRKEISRLNRMAQHCI